MVDPKRLIKSMELCMGAERDCHKCMYCETENDCRDSMIYDAVELLKEQEQKRGRWERITGMAPPEYHGHRICSICECFAPYDPLHMGRQILPKYCPG